MATKSFLKNIVIKNRKDANRFIDALEKAENKKEKKIEINGDVKDVKDKESIRKIFMTYIN